MIKRKEYEKIIDLNQLYGMENQIEVYWEIFRK